MVYKSGLGFSVRPLEPKLAKKGPKNKKAVLNMCKFLTLVLDELEGCVLQKNGVEFYQESSGHGLRHVKHGLHMSNPPNTHKLRTVLFLICYCFGV